MTASTYCCDGSSSSCSGRVGAREAEPDEEEEPEEGTTKTGRERGAEEDEEELWADIVLVSDLFVCNWMLGEIC